MCLCNCWSDHHFDISILNVHKHCLCLLLIAADPSRRSFSQQRRQSYLSKRDAQHIIVCELRVCAHHPPRRNASHKDLEIKQTTPSPPPSRPDKRRARTCYAHLVTRLGKLGAARLVPLSPPYSSRRRSHTHAFPPFASRLVSTTRSLEPPQTGTMSRYCDPLQAAESCISSSMFSLPISLSLFLSPSPPPPSWLYIDGVQCTRFPDAPLPPPRQY